MILTNCSELKLERFLNLETSCVVVIGLRDKYRRTESSVIPWESDVVISENSSLAFFCDGSILKRWIHGQTKC